jgi:dihydrofolate reductase
MLYYRRFQNVSEEIRMKGVCIMRKVVAGLFITLDGVVESPDKWQEHFDEDMGEAMMEQLSSQDAVLLGRVTYQEWASYWPTATDEPFASFINSTPKYVFSTTLDSVEEWKNSTLVKGDLAQEIAKLKQLPGKNIGTAGSPSLVYSLLEQDLLDELILLVHPVVAGNGKRLFKEGGNLKRLQLVSSKPTTTGTVILTYQLRKP